MIDWLFCQVDKQSYKAHVMLQVGVSKHRPGEEKLPQFQWVVCLFFLCSVSALLVTTAQVWVRSSKNMQTLPLPSYYLLSFPFLQCNNKQVTFKAGEGWLNVTGKQQSKCFLLPWPCSLLAAHPTPSAQFLAHECAELHSSLPGSYLPHWT